MNTLKWKTDGYTPHLHSGPFTLIKRRKDGKIFWIATVKIVPSADNPNKHEEVIVWGAPLREAKALAQKLVGETHFKGREIRLKSLDNP